MIRQMQEHRTLIFEEKEKERAIVSNGSNKALGVITN